MCLFSTAWAQKASVYHRTLQTGWPAGWRATVTYLRRSIFIGSMRYIRGHCELNMRVKGCCRFLAILSLIFLSVRPGAAQRASETFGKNRVQYRTFKWQYVSSENFDVYYYDERR